MSEFEVIPAIDILDGECVRLTRGNANAKTVYSKNPAGLALNFVRCGARTIHVIDLNAALGSGSNAPAIKAITKAVRGNALIQVGGGVRDARKAKQLFSLGVDRIIVGTAAFTPELEKIAALGDTLVAIDYARGAIQVKGWTSQAAKVTPRVLEGLENKGITGFLATDVERDGTLKGTRTKTLEALVNATRLPIYAAGGVASIGDVREAARAGADGIVIGKALYEKKFSLHEALEVAKQC